MKSYSNYKDSGVKWLGQIPQHWECVELKRLAIFSPTKKLELNENTLVGYSPMNCIRTATMQPSVIEVRKLSSGLTYFEEGDVVLAKVTPCFENGNVAVVPKMVHQCGYGSSELFVYRCKEHLDKKFLLYFFLCRQFINAGVATMSGTGGLKRVSSHFARTARTPLPPLSEQLSIVSYLDGKVSAMDRLVLLTQQKVEHLKALKQAIIQEAVTRGIPNKNHKLKQTNIKWIKQIPQHWEVKSIRSILKLAKEKAEVDGMQLLSLSQYTGVTAKADEDKTGMFRAESTIGYNIVHKGQFVMNIMLAWNGSYAVSSLEGVISPAYCVFDFIGEVNKQYINYLFSIADYQQMFKAYSTGLIASRLRLYPNKFLPLPYHCPPLSEQEEIVAYLDEKTAKIDLLIDKELQQIDHIKDLKQTLIADVVTGKVDVTTKH